MSPTKTFAVKFNSWKQEFEILETDHRYLNDDFAKIGYNTIEACHLEKIAKDAYYRQYSDYIPTATASHFRILSRNIY